MANIIWDTCPNWGGSGEDMGIGYRCGSCNGTGVVEIDLDEEDEPDDLDL